MHADSISKEFPLYSTSLISLASEETAVHLEKHAVAFALIDCFLPRTLEKCSTL